MKQSDYFSQRKPSSVHRARDDRPPERAEFSGGPLEVPSPCERSRRTKRVAERADRGLVSLDQSNRPSNTHGGGETKPRFTETSSPPAVEPRGSLLTLQFCAKLKSPLFLIQKQFSILFFIFQILFFIFQILFLLSLFLLTVHVQQKQPQQLLSQLQSSLPQLHASWFQLPQLPIELPLQSQLPQRSSRLL